MSRPLFVKTGSQQKAVTDAFVKKDGEYKRIKLLYSKVNGEWKHKHEYGDWEVTFSPSCTTVGTETSTCPCEACQTKTIPALGHNFNNKTLWSSERQLRTEATCTEDATYYIECQRCAVNTNTDGNSSTNGYFTASECTGGNETPVKALGHTVSDGPYVSQSDTHHWSVYYCAKCDTYQTVSGTYEEHNQDGLEMDTPPTCTEPAYNHSYCTICGRVITGGLIGDPPTGHSFTEEVVADKYLATDADCTQPAWYWHSCHCGESGQGYANGDTMFTVGTVLGHSWGDWVTTTPATCTTDGEETRTCSRNSSHKETRSIPATGHDWGSWITTTSATCTTDGVETRTCSNNPSHKETRSIPATGMHFFTEEVVADKYLTFNADCTSPAWYWRSCHCGESGYGHEGADTFSVGEPLGHNLTEDSGIVTIPATCTTAALHFAKCSRCDYISTRTGDGISVGEPLGHDWGGWVTTTSATCTTDGIETRTCSRNSTHKETRSIPALGHNEDGWEIDTPATCTDPAYGHTYCTRCEQYGSGGLMDTNNPALGHSYTLAGYQYNGDGTHSRVGECKRCGHERVYSATQACSGNAATCLSPSTCDTCDHIIQAALGHDMQYTGRTTTIGGVTKYIYKCTRCSATEYRNFANA